MTLIINNNLDLFFMKINKIYYYIDYHGELYIGDNSTPGFLVTYKSYVVVYR